MDDFTKPFEQINIRSNKIFYEEFGHLKKSHPFEQTKICSNKQILARK